MSSRFRKVAAHALVVAAIVTLVAFVYRSITVDGSKTLDDWPTYVGTWVFVALAVVCGTYIGLWAERFVKEGKGNGADVDSEGE